MGKTTVPIQFYASPELVDKFKRALSLEGATASTMLRKVIEAYADAMLTTNAQANYEKAVNSYLAKSDLGKISQPKGA